MDGAIAWQLIERHADDWSEIGAMMEAWLKANVEAEREDCIEDVRTVGGSFSVQCEDLMRARWAK